MFSHINVNKARTGSSQENKRNKDEEGDGGGDPPTFTEFLEYILHEDMTGACKEGRQTDSGACNCRPRNYCRGRSDMRTHSLAAFELLTH